jgi:hypothetical protein
MKRTFPDMGVVALAVTDGCRTSNCPWRPRSSAPEIVERRLRDGSTFRVIENFVDPDRLELRLRRLGLGLRDSPGR